MPRTRSLPGLTWLLLVPLGASARADEVRLADGRAFGPGSVVAIGPTRLLFDGERAGLVFCERQDVSQVLDAQGQPRDWERAAAGESDPVGVVTKLVGSGVRVRRREEEVPVALHGALAVLRDGDVLRTGPYGRATLAVPGGGLLTARSDALVRFQEGKPILLEGVIHAEHGSGTLAVWIAEARVETIEGQAVVERLRGRTRLTCLGGRALLHARDGWRVELPRNHSLDLKPEGEQEPASLAASNANAWPVRLEHGGRWVSIQPGERVILLGVGAPAAAPSPTLPPTLPAPPTSPPPPSPPVAAPPVNPAPVEGAALPTSAAAGRVVRAGGSFSLRREGAVRQVDRAQGSELALQAGDEVETGQGELVLELAGARLRLLPRGHLVVAPPEGGPPRLVRGEATVETESRVTLAFPLGEVGLLRGAVAVRAAEREATVSLRQGTAGARFGLEVRVPLLPGCELMAAQSGSRLQLSTPTGAPDLSPVVGSLEARLRAGQTLSFSRTGEMQVAELPGARVELLGPVRAQVVAGAGELDQLELEDGRRFPLSGTLRFARRGDQVEVLSGEQPLAGTGQPPAQPAQPLPPPTQPAPAPLTAGAGGPAVAAPPPAAPSADGTVRQVLANGAVLFTRDWGQLQVKRQVGTDVEVEGPSGSLWFGAHVHARLERLRNGRVRVDATDGRFVDWDAGGLPFELRLQEDGRLQVSIDRGGLRRSVEVESGCEFDLLIRPDHARAFVFGQVKYVEPGQVVSVTRRGGLRTQVAAGPR